MQIKIMADYGCSPLWWDQPDRIGDIRPEELGLSRELATDLWAWAATYDCTLDQSDPASSGFASKDEERVFQAQGKLLTKRVAEELGSNASVSSVI